MKASRSFYLVFSASIALVLPMIILMFDHGTIEMPLMRIFYPHVYIFIEMLKASEWGTIIFLPLMFIQTMVYGHFVYWGTAKDKLKPVVTTIIVSHILSSLLTFLV